MTKFIKILLLTISLGFAINLVNISASHALFEKGICVSKTYSSKINVKYSYSGKCKDFGTLFISKNDYPSYQGKKYSGFDGSGANKKYGTTISISSMMNRYRSDEVINKVYKNFDYYKKNKNFDFYIIDLSTFNIGKFKNGEFIADSKIDQKKLNFCADIFYGKEILEDGYFTDADSCPLETKIYQIADKIKWDFNYSINFSKAYLDQKSFYINTTGTYSIFLGKKQTDVARKSNSSAEKKIAEFVKTESSKTQNSAEQVSLKLNKNEVDTLFSSVNSCWSIPLGLPYNEDLSIKIKVKFDPIGNAIKTEIIDHAKINKKGNAYLKVLAESALRAIKLCSPIRAPKDKYNLWKEVVFNFDAQDVLNGVESKDTKIAKNNLLKKSIETKIAKAEPSQTQKWTIENIRELEKAVHNQNESERILFDLYKKYKFTPNDLKYAPRDYVKFERPKGRALLYQSILLAIGKNTTFANDTIVINSFYLKKAFERDGLENAFVFELSKLLKKANPVRNYEVFYKNNIEPKITQIAKAETKEKVDKKIAYNFCASRGASWYWTSITLGNCRNNSKVSPQKFIKIRLTRVTGSEPDNRSVDQRFFEELDKLLSEFKVYDLPEKLIYDTIENDNLLASISKKQTKIAKTNNSNQNETIKKKVNADKEAPVIEIADTITVKDTTYEIAGMVKDKSDTVYIEIDGQTILAENGKFKFQKYSPVDHQLQIVAIDQWGNRSEPKMVDVKINIQVAGTSNVIEPLNPSKLRAKIDRNKVALVIGVEKYENSPSAKYASLDAKYFKDYARKVFGVREDNINLLTDEEANLSKTNSAFFKWLPSKIKSNQTDLIIFYAGHGLASTDGKEKYILPFNADPDLLSRTAISRNEIFDQIISLNPRSVTIFFDTCYSGVSRDEQMLLASARPLRVIADDEEQLPDNFTIFSASKNDQISSGLSDAKHGIFSYFLMKGLEGKADLNGDRKLTNNELLTYLDDNVSEKALDLGRQQNPTLSGNPEQVLARY